MSLLVDRHWDPEYAYPGAVLKTYPHWCLEVSYRQHTLASYVIFCRRKDVRLITDLQDDELVSLKSVMAEIELALKAHPMFRPDHFNYWQMGNGLPLLHFHGMPRYKVPRGFDGMTWSDLTWGHPPKWTKTQMPRVFIERLRTQMAKYL